MLHSVLVPVGLKGNSEVLLERAGRLPLSAGARLALLHVLPKRLSALAEYREQGEARRALERARLALPLKVRERAEVVVRIGTVESEIAEVGQRMNAELTLVGQPDARRVERMLWGSTPERLLRRLRKPVLVSRTRAAGAYARPLIALGFDAAAEAALSVMMRVVPPPRPAMALVHVYQGPPLGMIFPALSRPDAHDVKQQVRHGVVASVDALLARARCGVDVVRWRARLLSGHPASLVRDTALQLQSDLLVLGSRASSPTSHALRGSVFRQLLNEARCDLLVVPPP